MDGDANSLQLHLFSIVNMWDKYMHLKQVFLIQLSLKNILHLFLVFIISRGES